MEKKETELSIIIVSYNEEAYLKTCIESIINQSLQNWELIIGDDGSSDNSLEIIKSYCEKYPDKIKYYVVDRNDGVKIPSLRVSNNLKRGFALAKGKYIAAIAGDDFYCNNNKLERDVKFLNENKKFVACVSCFKYSFPNHEKDFVVGNNSNRVIYWSHEYTDSPCFTFRKECLKNLLPNFCDDTGLVFSIACTGKWKCFNSVDFVYRQRENSIMSSSNEVQLNLLELLLYNDVKTLKKYKLSSLSRFSKPMKFVFNNRKQIVENKQKYETYLSQDEQDNGIISTLLNYDKLSSFKKFKCKFGLFRASMLRCWFAFIKNIQKLFKRLTKGGGEPWKLKHIHLKSMVTKEACWLRWKNLKTFRLKLKECITFTTHCQV